MCLPWPRLRAGRRSRLDDRRGVKELLVRDRWILLPPLQGILVWGRLMTELASLSEHALRVLVDASLLGIPFVHVLAVADSELGLLADRRHGLSCILVPALRSTIAARPP